MYSYAYIHQDGRKTERVLFGFVDTTNTSLHSHLVTHVVLAFLLRAFGFCAFALIHTIAPVIVAFEDGLRYVK